MTNKFIKSNLIPGILTLSLLTTSFGGAFAVSAAAAAPDKTGIDETVQTTPSKNDILAGLAAVGLITMLSHHGNSSDSASSGKTTISSPSSTPTSTQTTTQTLRPTSTQTTKPRSTQSSTGSSASEEQQAVNLLNQDRAANGLPALKVNAKLTGLAASYAKDMINRGYFSHYNPEGQSPFDRMRQVGISFRTAGENLAQNISVPAAETAFMNSSGHRANILNSSYTEVGIGVVHSSDGSVYVVQEFIGN